MGYGRDRRRQHSEPNSSDTSRLDNMDPPDHPLVRSLASRAFAPVQIGSISGWFEGMTTELLDDIQAKRSGAHFIELFALRLPLQSSVAFSTRPTPPSLNSRPGSTG